VLTAVHILGITNTSADQLSRNQQSLFLLSNPRASQLPTSIPAPHSESYPHADQIGPHFASENYSKTLYREELNIISYLLSPGFYNIQYTIIVLMIHVAHT